MNITITTYPDDKKIDTFNIKLHYNKDTSKKLPFVLQSGICTVPCKGETIRNIPLKEGFTFSGRVLDEPIVDEEKETILIYLVEILISRDGRLQPELSQNAIREILLSKHLE